MADEARIREILQRLFEYTGADVERAEELYHEDAVLEFPQSGERFEGRAAFTEWRSNTRSERMTCVTESAARQCARTSPQSR